MTLLSLQGAEGEERVCVFAALFNGTQLARITVKDHSRPVLYVGDLDEVVSLLLSLKL